MNRIIFTFLLGVLFYACTNYENNERYTISVGEEVEIYYFTNSCCTYKIANLDQLDHIEFIEEKTIDTGPKDCSGCDYTYAFVFKAVSKGVDTLKLKHIVMSKQNDNTNDEQNKFIIEVSKGD